MSNLKEYVVVRRKTGALELQQTIFYNHWHKGNPDYKPVATFNSNEDLEQGEIETLKAENSKMRQALEAEGYCTMCHEKKKKRALLVCDTCYDSFDGDRRSFWEDDFIH